jgi:hypothetical protein
MKRRRDREEKWSHRYGRRLRVSFVLIVSTDLQTERQIERETDRQRDGEKERKRVIETDIYILTDRNTDRHPYRQTDIQKFLKTDWHTDRKTNRHLYTD